MHPKIAQRREQLTGRRGFRVPGEYIRNPEPWETFSLPGQPQRKPEPPKVTRIQPLVRMQRMSLADAEQYMHEQALRNIAAAQRNRTQK